MSKVPVLPPDSAILFSEAFADNNEQDTKDDSQAAPMTPAFGPLDDSHENPPSPEKTKKDELPDFDDDYEETGDKNSEAVLVVPHASEGVTEASPPNSKPLSGNKAHPPKGAERTSTAHITPAKITKQGDVKPEVSPQDGHTVADPPDGFTAFYGPAICSSCKLYGTPRPAESQCLTCNETPMCNECIAKHYCWDCCALHESYHPSEDPRIAPETTDRVICSIHGKSHGKTNCNANDDGTFTCKDEQPCAMPRKKRSTARQRQR